MSHQLNCIMLVDDNKTDNFFHERVIIKNEAAKAVVVCSSGNEALDYLTNTENTLQPDLIFLDINMPGLNGWEVIEEYKKLERAHKCMIVVMTSQEPGDTELAITKGLHVEYRPKPITKEMLADVIKKSIA